MNILLWVLQGLGALPKRVWNALGVVELLCTVGLILPSALRWQPQLTGLSAGILALESLVFIGVHVRYREVFLRVGGMGFRFI